MLAVEALCKRFGGFLAVNQVSFEAFAECFDGEHQARAA